MSHVPSLEWSAQQAAAEEPLAERITGWQDRYPDVSVEGVVVWDQPARRLLDQSESTQLVVVGSHGRGGFAGCCSVRSALPWCTVLAFLSSSPANQATGCIR